MLEMAFYGRGRGVDFEFAPYVSVAERRARARKVAEKIARKRGLSLAPVGPLEGSKIVRTFWGKAWCDNLQSYSDYATRLPRGRSYVRHGAVIDLQIASGKVTALVSGTSMYETTIAIRSLESRRWKEIAGACTGRIDSLIDLLKGNLSQQVMEIVTRKERGLFPAPGQISLECSCPDWADMCKHVAAVLYGVGVRLDEQPDLLFRLRGVDHLDLIGGAAENGVKLGAHQPGSRKIIESPDLSELFGIEIEAGSAPQSPLAPPAKGKKSSPRKVVSRKRR
jgi:uncharacterized Zn finger protein